jgi:hypothetical protein
MSSKDYQLKRDNKKKGNNKKIIFDIENFKQQPTPQPKRL